MKDDSSQLNRGWRLAVRWPSQRPFSLPVLAKVSLMKSGNSRADETRCGANVRACAPRALALLGLGLAVAFILSGCSSVGVHQQRMVSKPNMLFSDSAIFAYHPKLLVQMEPGSAATGGAQAAGCTSCR